MFKYHGMNRLFKTIFTINILVFSILFIFAIIVTMTNRKANGQEDKTRIIKVDNTNITDDNNPFTELNSTYELSGTNISDLQVVEDNKTEDNTVQESYSLDEILNNLNKLEEEQKKITENQNNNNDDSNDQNNNNQDDNTDEEVVIEVPKIDYSDVKPSKITSPTPKSNYETKFTSTNVTFKWERNTNSDLIEKHRLEIKYEQNNVVIFQTTIDDSKQTEYKITDLPKNGRKVNVELVTYYNNNTSDSQTYGYTLFEEKSNIQIKAYKDVKIGDDPKIKIYINQEYTGQSSAIKESKKDDFSSLKTYSFDIPKIDTDTLLSIVYDNDTDGGARDLYITKIVLDDKTIFEKKNDSSNSIHSNDFNIKYDRANRNDGEQYPNSDDWGDIENGFFDGKGISGWDIYAMLWNGAINITKK